MEFEEMQKVWNEQKSEAMYVINEDALHNRIKSKKRAASRRINTVEISLMCINSAVSIFLLVDAIVDNEGFWDYASSAIMALTVFFIILFRRRRIRTQNQASMSLGKMRSSLIRIRRCPKGRG